MNTIITGKRLMLWAALVTIFTTNIFAQAPTSAIKNQNAAEYNLIYLPENYAAAKGGVYFVHFIVGDRRVVERVVMVR
ncbi:MAG: hypothetical protein NTX03_09915 [Bacteroidetes bacterium]|nr:hypothetical protein [Bacteroidota bacterium]